MKSGLILLVSVILLTSCAIGLTPGSIMKDSAAAMKFCAESPEDKKTDCYFFISDVLKTSEVQTAANACSSIPDENDRQGCFMQTFEANNDTDSRAVICRKIEDSNFKKGCIEDTVKDETDAKKAAALCNEITDDSNFKEHCLNLVMGSAANTEEKLAACEVSSNSRCYEDVAYSIYDTNPTEAVEICRKIPDQSQKNNCLNYFLSSPELIKANPTIAISICGEFTLKDSCYSNVAQTLSAIDGERAAEVCKKLSDEIQISNCFVNVWLSFDSRVRSNYEFTVNFCKTLNLKKNDCYKRVSDAFRNYDDSKAESACELIDDGSSDSCLQMIN